MKSALIAGYLPNLFELMVAAMREEIAGIREHPGTAQFATDDGKLFTLFELSVADMEEEYQLGPYERSDGGGKLDTQGLFACYAECRWEELLSHIAMLLADKLGTNLWVLDGDSIAWPAKEIDVNKIAL